MANAILQGQDDSAKLFGQITTVFDILSKESLLTPIAQHGGDTMLILKKETLTNLEKVFLTGSNMIEEGVLMSFATPVDIRTDGKTIQLTAYDASMIHASLSRDVDTTPTFVFNIAQRGVSDPTLLNFTATPSSGLLRATSAEYAIDAYASLTGALATLRE